MRSNDSNTYTLIFYDSSGGKGEEIIVTPSWKRYVLDASTSYKNSNPQSATSASLIFGLRNDPTSIIYFTGNTNSQTADILAWGPQIEAGAFPTSYIPTSGSALPRAADVASITGSNFSRWYNQSEGTIFFRAKSPTNPVQYPVVIDDNTNNNRHLFAISNAYQYQIKVSGSTEAQIDAGSVLSSFNYIAGGYKTNNTAVALNGSVDVDNDAKSPTCNRLSIYQYSGFTYTGHIARLTYYPYRLPDATLQEITS
jgi:hypothetical protein